MRCLFLWLAILAVAAANIQADDEVPAVTEAQATDIGKVVETLKGETRVDVIEVSVADVCADIGETNKLKVVIDPAAAKKAETIITLSLKAMSIRESLAKILEPQGLTYKIRPDGY
jgi:hypothetical protein